MKELLLAVILALLWLLVKFLRKEAMFVPLPMGTVRKMLDMAEIRKSDVLYDLGSGDGRISIEAARKYGIKSVAVEKNGILCWLSKFKSRNQNRVKIIRGDLFKQKISDATIVTLYLSQRMNDLLEPKLKRELKKGARIVSADHTLRGMKEAGRLKAGHMYLHLYKA